VRVFLYYPRDKQAIYGDEDETPVSPHRKSLKNILVPGPIDFLHPEQTGFQ